MHWWLVFPSLSGFKKRKAKHTWVSDNTSEESLCTRHPQLVPEFRLSCEKGKPPLWFTECPRREHPQKEIREESCTLNSLSKGSANWLWLEVSSLYILLLQTPQSFHGYSWRMVFGHHLCLFSRKSEDWSRFWGHADRLIHFSGQIHITAYVPAKWALCNGSACSQPGNMQTHLPIAIWFGPGIEASSKKIWECPALFYSFFAKTSSSYSYRKRQQHDSFKQWWCFLTIYR